MPFHFKKAEPPDRAVRRVCREHIGEALDGLRQSRHPAAIHGVRKEIKKLRAIFQLVQGGMSRGGYRRVTRPLRRAADRLAVPRDAWVMLQAFGKLAGGAASRRFPELRKTLQKHYRSTNQEFRDDDAIAVAKRNLRKIKRRLAGLEIDANSWAAIEPGLRRSYGRGRQAAELARRQPSAENFHDWRKRVKNLGYQLRLLCPEWPASARGMTDKLEQLGEVLGDDHDLDLLQEFAAAHEAGQAGELTRLIVARQRQLRTTAFRLGSLLYAGRPAFHCRHLGNYWNDWHGEAFQK